MKNKFLKGLVASFALSVSGLANAGLITFNDRASFEAYIGSGFITENLESAGSVRGSSSHTVSSNDFTWTMSDYNCENGDGCYATFGAGNPNTSAMMDAVGDDFIWTYTDGLFNFSSGITSFGIQFGSYYGDSSVTLNGLSSGIQNSGSFFGIASDDNSKFSSVSYNKSLDYGLFDEVTYSRNNASASSIDVPEPSTLAVFALGLIGLAYRKSNNQA